MKTILCYGDSNTWGSPPVIPNGALTRYGPDTRWGSVLRTSLGEGYWVVEEGLNGRTTVWADPIEGEYKSGKNYLYACLESHQPIDLVAMMLGTNDLKHRFGLSPWDIASGVGVLASIILSSPFGPEGKAPKLLIMCPPPIARLSNFAEMLIDATEKSRQLPPYYKAIAEQYGCDFMDAGQIITSSDADGIHFEASEQRKLGAAVAVRIKDILR